MTDYRFERVNETNLKDLVFLYRHAFGQNVALDFLSKKFDTQSFGTKFIGFIAYAQNTNEAAAYYGVFPLKVKNQIDEFLVAQSGDTMTHPAHRGKGLFIHLAKLTYELAKSEGIQFVFGFPNDNSFPGFVKKLDWKHYANVCNYSIKSGALPFEKLAKRFTLFSPVYKMYVSKIIGAYETSQIFENSLAIQNSQMGFVKHDYQFKEYKSYSSCKLIEVAGSKCWIKVDGRLWVGDIEFCEQEKFYKVIDELKNLSRKLFCSGIQFSVFEGSLYDQWLRKYGEPFFKNPVGFVNLNSEADGAEFGYQGVDFDTY